MTFGRRCRKAFGNVTVDRLGEERPTCHDVARAFNSIAMFLNAVSDQQLDLLTIGQRVTIQAFLFKAAERFAPPVERAE